MSSKWVIHVQTQTMCNFSAICPCKPSEFECGEPEQTADPIINSRPLHRPPSEACIFKFWPLNSAWLQHTELTIWYDDVWKKKNELMNTWWASMTWYIIQVNNVLLTLDRILKLFTTFGLLIAKSCSRSSRWEAQTSWRVSKYDPKWVTNDWLQCEYWIQ